MESLQYFIRGDLKLLKKSVLTFYRTVHTITSSCSASDGSKLQYTRVQNFTHRKTASKLLLGSTGTSISTNYHHHRASLTTQLSIQTRKYCHTQQDYNSSKHSDRPTIRQLRDEWTDRLIQLEVPEADTSAELIIAHAMGEKMFHRVDHELVPSNEQMKHISEMMENRKARMPVQYVIEEWDFFDMTLKMRPPVFIPRPETEELAQLIHRNSDTAECKKFLEIGCGSGAISVYLLRVLAGDAKGVAIDINPAACSLTEENATLHHVSDRLTVRNLDINSTEAVGELTSEDCFDIIVSNPPYILTDDIPLLAEEIARYEDHRALDGDQDGLSIVRRILDIAPSLLRPGGHIWLEVGLGHPRQIQTEVENNKHCGLEYIATYKDFTKRERFCHLQKR